MRKELEIIKTATIDGTGKEANISREIRNLIEDVTDCYANPDAISTEKVDMTDTIIQYGFSVEDYKKQFGSVMRSEADAVADLAKQLKPDASASSDDAKAKAKAKAKMKIKLKMLLLLKI